MKFPRGFFLLLILTSLTFSGYTQGRLKDLITVKGVRENPLIGYGLVIGLSGTGDGGGDVTTQSLKKMFQSLGLKDANEVSANNVAAVIVTATLAPFARIGQKMDVTVSSIGDASSLQGGTLLVTPLKGGDGKIYAVASGKLSLGGAKAAEKGAASGRIPDGAVVEKEMSLDFHNRKGLRLALKRPDFTTAARIEKVINMELGGRYATAKDSTTIDLIVPPQYESKVVKLLAVLENVAVESDRKAKIVINEKTGTIVAGGDVILHEVAIGHGDLVIEVGAGQEGESAKGPKHLHLVKKSTTLKELVEALNAIGTSPEDLISIFQALKKNGGLIAELEFL